MHPFLLAEGPMLRGTLAPGSPIQHPQAAPGQGPLPPNAYVTALRNWLTMMVCQHSSVTNQQLFPVVHHNPAMVGCNDSIIISESVSYSALGLAQRLLGVGVLWMARLQTCKF